MKTHLFLLTAALFALQIGHAQIPQHLNTSLFTLLGTRYGGNGTSHFALPDLRNAAPVGTP